MRIIIARPTAASAAATTITKKTNTWPCSCPRDRLKDTKARLTALSISSMDIKTVRMLRLKINAITPNPNRPALSTRKYEVGTTSPPEISDNGHQKYYLLLLRNPASAVAATANR